MTRKYAILGETLRHTMSPPIHARLFELRGRSFEYEVVEVNAQELADKAEYLNSMSGYNITIPHKVEIIKYIDRLGESARRYNSVNCVDNKNGVLTGYNTDCDGFLHTVRAMGASLSGEVLLIGCGGVGRMMAIETALQGGELTIAVRPNNLNLAQKVTDEIHRLKPNASVRTVLLDHITGSYDLTINATPAGMYPHADNTPISEEDIQRTSYLFDAVYNPIETKLMKTAKQNGVITLGLSLIHI